MVRACPGLGPRIYSVTEISPSLGNLGYWHLVEGAPDGPPSKAEAELLDMVQRHAELPAARWPIPPVVVRAMAVELAVACGNRGEALSAPLVQLLTWCAGVPDGFVSDPPAFYGGNWQGGKKPNDARAKVHASWVDRRHYQQTGEWMPLLRLEQTLAAAFGEGKAPARSTLRRWRDEEDYAAWVVFDPDSATGDT